MVTPLYIGELLKKRKLAPFAREALNNLLEIN